MSKPVVTTYARSRVEKIGVKPGHRLALLGLKDADFVLEAKQAGARVTSRAGAGPYDIVMVRLDSAEDLGRLSEARKLIPPAGMVWAVWPKGRKEFREDDIRNFGPRAGLVDVKVMAFSAELSGLKLVIPVKQR